MNEKIRIVIPGYEKSTVNYRNALAALGAEAECVEGPEVDPEKYDGMLLPGGGDMDPARYGRQDEGSEPPDAALDERQIVAFEAFRKAGKPIFGICRGIQVINVCLGGTLIQDIPQKQRHSRMGGPDDKVHLCTAEEDSVMHALYGKSFLTNSAHHQAIEKPGKGLKVTLWSDDGVAEAVEHETEPIWGVQWHPERMCFILKRNDGSVDGKEILQAFLDLCSRKTMR